MVSSGPVNPIPESRSNAAIKTHRFIALDGLRVVAAPFIVFYHLQVSNHVTHVQLIRNGYLAVDLFFILSGFVIYSSYSSRINSIAPFRIVPLLGLAYEISDPTWAK